MKSPVIFSTFLLLQPTKSQVTCGTTGITTNSCSNCPELGEWACTSPTCSWMKHTNLCRDVFTDGVRTAAVHLVYDQPREVRQPAWWFQELVVKASSDATSFSTNGQNFGFGSVLEVRKEPFLGRVTFSIKGDSGNGMVGCDEDCDGEDVAKTVACGSGITCEFPSNDGSVTSYFDTTELPVSNQPYYFITYAQPTSEDESMVDYSGFFHAPSIYPTWKFISRIRIIIGKKFWWHGGIFSSIEQQEPINTLDDRSGLFGPSFMSDLTDDPSGMSFFQIRSAYFSFGLSDNHEHINAFHEDGAVGLATGGDAVQEVSKWTKFNYPVASKPTHLIEFAKFIPCLNTAMDTISIEACLKQSDTNK